jgi:hypothetical protein
MLFCFAATQFVCNIYEYICFLDPSMWQKILWVILVLFKICSDFIYKLKIFLCIYCRSFLGCVGPGINVVLSALYCVLNVTF